METIYLQSEILILVFPLVHYYDIFWGFFSSCWLVVIHFIYLGSLGRQSELFLSMRCHKKHSILLYADYIVIILHPCHAQDEESDYVYYVSMASCILLCY